MKTLRFQGIDPVRRSFLTLALLALPSLAADAPVPARPRPAAPRPSSSLTLTSTWYGRALQGRLTAWHFHGRPGTRFDPGGLTAAHRSLPFGSRLRVTRGGKSVLVTVTDRGPEG